MSKPLKPERAKKRAYMRTWCRENKANVRKSQITYYQKNRERVLLYSRQWYAANRERQIILSRRNKWLKKYGISGEDYERLLAAQNGTCAICQQKQERLLSVDHCHKSGAVRGLLCVKCNSALGMIGDDLGLVCRIIDYLTPKLEIVAA